MKIILSRKGFDSSAGGVASPILPDGTLLSLPIPSQSSPISYGGICCGSHSLGSIVEDLTRGRVTREDSAHLDPDLLACAYLRQAGWRALFGQAGAAQSHLARAQVTEGDLFLFFGWFRQTELVGGRYQYAPGAPDLHVIYGWLQVNTVLHLQEDQLRVPRWAVYHPHFHGTFSANNTLYIARESLCLGREQTDRAGGGVFDRYCDSLRLTAPGNTRSIWQIPEWFCPKNGSLPLSYHLDPKRWTPENGYTILRSAQRGQEFVLDADQYPEAVTWAHQLITDAVHR